MIVGCFLDIYLCIHGSNGEIEMSVFLLLQTDSRQLFRSARRLGCDVGHSKVVLVTVNSRYMNGIH